jgi:hypothetical protein
MIIKQYDLKANGEQCIDLGGNMPAGYSVAVMDGKPVLWVQLEEDYPGQFLLDVLVVETGEQYERLDFFAGSAVLGDGSVRHIFVKHRYVRADS